MQVYRLAENNGETFHPPTLITQFLNQILRSKVSLKEETREAGASPAQQSPQLSDGVASQSRSREQLFTLYRAPPPLRTEAHNNAWEEETSRPLPRWWPSSRPGLSRPLPALSAPLEPLSQSRFTTPAAQTLP